MSSRILRTPDETFTVWLRLWCAGWTQLGRYLAYEARTEMERAHSLRKFGRHLQRDLAYFVVRDRWRRKHPHGGAG